MELFGRLLCIIYMYYFELFTGWVLKEYRDILYAPCLELYRVRNYPHILQYHVVGLVD